MDTGIVTPKHLARIKLVWKIIFPISRFKTICNHDNRTFVATNLRASCRNCTHAFAVNTGSKSQALWSCFRVLVTCVNHMALFQNSANVVFLTILIITTTCVFFIVCAIGTCCYQEIHLSWNLSLWRKDMTTRGRKRPLWLATFKFRNQMWHSEQVFETRVTSFHETFFSSSMKTRGNSEKLRARQRRLL